VLGGVVVQRRMAAGLVILVLCLWGWVSATGQDVQDQAYDVYDEVIRIHVVANSDSSADQALKLVVKDEVVNLMRERLEGVEDVAEARRETGRLLPEIRQAAAHKIEAEGYDYPVQAALGEYDFPTKYYGDLVFPGGRYTAVRVVIGEGEGKNWWCVLFPPLCLVSGTDQGLSLHPGEQAQVKLKCAELLKRSTRISHGSKN
jgi:stage II sporulation protein R